jgi:cytochrome c oxidase subunit 3
MREEDAMSPAQDGYFIPEPSHWPLVATTAVFGMLAGTALAINQIPAGFYFLAAGLLLFAVLLFGWFGDVARESLAGFYNARVDRSFRQGMFWFIASEVFFFLAFFGSLYYLRNISLDWLGGAGYLSVTRELLYPGFEGQWPTAGPEQVGGPFTPMAAMGIPAINTLILLTSGATVTWAHWGLKLDRRPHLLAGLVATIALGLLFVVLQAWEYREAYQHLNLTLRAGVYGSTFYILTGFHGFHVTMGAIMLLAILARSLRGHFTPKNHFAFEAVAWYWHFVDVVWLGLFVFVYWL